MPLDAIKTNRFISAATDTARLNPTIHLSTSDLPLPDTPASRRAYPVTFDRAGTCCRTLDSQHTTRRSPIPALRPGSGQACALPRAAHPSTTAYRPRRPGRRSSTKWFRGNLEEWLARVREAEPEKRIRSHALWSGTCAGISTAGSWRAALPAPAGGCGHDFLIAYFCKGRGICPGAWRRVPREEAWQIAERGAMKLHMADILLHRARLFRDAGSAGGRRTAYRGDRLPPPRRRSSPTRARRWKSRRD